MVDVRFFRVSLAANTTHREETLSSRLIRTFGLINNDGNGPSIEMAEHEPADARVEAISPMMFDEDLVLLNLSLILT